MTHGALALSPASQSGDRPITRLRAWLDHLASKNRLAVARSGAALEFEVAAIAKRLDGTKATLFPSPSQHHVPVVSGLIADRGWMAEAMGVPAGKVIERFQSAALSPIPWKEVKSAPAQQVVHRDVELLLGALPNIMAGVKLGIGMGLILIAIAEMIGAREGIGYMIWNAWQILAVDTMYVGLMVIAILGFVFNLILDAVEHAVVPWRNRNA